MSELSEQEIVERLARRGGWKPEVRKRYAGDDNVKGWGRNTHLSLGHRDREFLMDPASFSPYLTSLDALQPVLAGLTPEEWGKLHDKLQLELWPTCPNNRKFGYTLFLLTLPPSVLARAVAWVIDPRGTKE